MKLEIMRGIMHGKPVIAINERRVWGMKDGKGYVTVQEFEIPDKEVLDSLKDPQG